MIPSSRNFFPGPNILSKKNADPYDTSDFGHIYQLVQYFIEQYEKLFLAIEEDRKKYEEKEQRELEERKEKESLEKGKKIKKIIGSYCVY